MHFESCESMSEAVSMRAQTSAPPAKNRASIRSASASSDVARSVLLAHPGGQYSERTAVALYRAGLLQRFITGVRYSASGPLADALRGVPAARAESLHRVFSRRAFPGI